MTTANDERAPVRALGTILSIWAHPDDETYLSGGTMAAARDNGQRVVCASATAGEHGTGDPGTWSPARLGRVRRWEAAAAMAVLGVEQHRVEGLPDGALDDHEPAGVAWVAQLLVDVRPDTILTFGADGMTYHPDHVAVHRWVTRAWQERGCRGRLLYAAPTADHLVRFRDLYEQWDMYMADQRPLGVGRDRLALDVRLDRSELDRKFVALRAMATQTADVITALDPSVYREMIAEESFVEAVGAAGRGPAWAS